MCNRFLFSVILGSSGFLCFAQQRKEAIQNYLPTENLEVRKDSNKRKNEPKRKSYAFIYVPNADKILYGNSCMLGETRKMGFEYIVEPRNIVGSKRWSGKFLNNLQVKIKLVIIRSPFWKLILKKKIKKCRRMSGDLVG